MSQDAPVSIHDDDSGPPEQMTNILLREDSRANMPMLRPPTLVSTSSSMVNSGSQPIPAASAAATAVVAATCPIVTAPVPAAMGITASQSVATSVPQAVPTAPGSAVVAPHRLHPQQHQQPHQQPHQQTHQQAHQHNQQPAQQPAQQHQPQPSQPPQPSQSPQPQQQAGSVARNQYPHESAAQSAVWNCVFYNIKVYQNSILNDLPSLISVAQEKIEPHKNIAATAIYARLEAAMKRMNSRVLDLRKDRKKMAYDTVIMSKLLQTQNKIIFEELNLKMGLNVQSLRTVMDLDRELKKRADAAHQAVKAKVDKAKRADANRLAEGAGRGGGANGAGRTGEFGAMTANSAGDQSSVASRPVTPLNPGAATTVANAPPAASPGVAVKSEEFEHSTQQAAPASRTQQPQVKPQPQAAAVSSVPAGSTLSAATSTPAVSPHASTAAPTTVAANGASVASVSASTSSAAGPASVATASTAPGVSVKYQTTPSVNTTAVQYGTTQSASTNIVTHSHTAQQPTNATVTPATTVHKPAQPMNSNGVVAQNPTQPAAAGAMVHNPSQSSLASVIAPHTQQSQAQPQPQPQTKSQSQLPQAQLPQPPQQMHQQVQQHQMQQHIQLQQQHIQHQLQHQHQPSTTYTVSQPGVPGVGTPVVTTSTLSGQSTSVPPGTSSTTAVTSASKPKIYNDEDKNGLQKLPPDKLESVRKEVEMISSEDYLREEEDKLRHAAILAAAEQEIAKPWFATNVVDHRQAWCCLRDAGEKAGMRRVLQARPWGNSANPLGGGKEAADSDVLKLMSAAAQHYLKDLLQSLKVIAWQRQGGLSGQLLRDLENRLEVTADMSDTEDGEPMMDRLDEELRAGLMPKISTPACDQPRVYLAKEEAAHRKECEEREARWEAEVADQQSMAEEVRKKLIRRGTKKLPPGSFRWWEDMETRAKSGWLSREQLASSEFARRVAVKHGIGVVASVMKKKEQAAAAAAAVSAAGSSNADPGEGASAASGATATHDNLNEKDGGAGGAAGSSAVDAQGSQGGKDTKRLPNGNPLDSIRAIKRRTMVDPFTENRIVGAQGGGTGGKDAGDAKSSAPLQRIEINNADLAELLRTIKPTGNPRGWAKILYRAQNNLPDPHAGGWPKESNR